MNGKETWRSELGPSKTALGPQKRQLGPQLDPWEGSKLYVNKIKGIGAKLSNLDGKSKNHIGGSCTTGLFFSAIFDEFALELRLKGYSENTIQSTCYNVKRFLKSMGVSPRRTGSSDIKHYISDMYESGRYCARSIRSMIESLKRFYSYLHQTGQIFCDPAGEIESTELRACIPKNVLTTGEMESIRKSVNGTSFLKLRDRAIIEVLYSTGLRLSELAALNIPDLDLSAGILVVQKGKGGRDRRAILVADAVTSIKKYLEYRCKNPDRENALWINYKGNRLSGQMIRKILNRYAEKAGVTTPAHPHAWRHGLATSLLRKGASIVEVQRFLGHVCVRSTQIYTHILIQDLKDVHRRCHPRECDFEKMKGRIEEWTPIFSN